MSRMFTEEWNEECRVRHEESVARGEHDAECEYDYRGFHLCHCSKRKREAEGFTSPPDEELYFPPPDCPRCGSGLDHDGDGFQCYGCSLCWSSDGTRPQFTDSYGDDLAADKAKWLENRLEVESRRASVSGEGGKGQ